MKRDKQGKKLAEIYGEVQKHVQNMQTCNGKDYFYACCNLGP